MNGNQRTDTSMQKVDCWVCGQVIEYPNTGLGRATFYAWRTQHQHPEVNR